MGFSAGGTLVAVLLLAPSLLLLPFPPQDVPNPGRGPGLLVTALERVGQVLTVTVLVLSGDRFPLGSPDRWALLTAVLAAGYLALWVRYARGTRTYASLFAPLGPVPVPMALVPVLAFASAAVWGRSVWLGAAVALLASGHVPVSLHARRTRPEGPGRGPEGPD
jgi:hypothetical protein